MLMRRFMTRHRCHVRVYSNKVNEKAERNEVNGRYISIRAGSTYVLHQYGRHASCFAFHLPLADLGFVG